MTTTDQIIFEIEAGKVLPKFARQRGQPYTGFATASDLIVDWSGYFLDGLPHGKFFICWGDRMSGHCFFERGVEVTQP